MITFAYVGVAAWEGPAMVTAIDYLIPLPRFGYLWTVAGFDVYLSWVLVGSLGGLILAIVNYRGVKPAAIFQTAATVAMAIGGILFFFVVGFGSVSSTPSDDQPSGLVVVLLMVPAMFVGFDVIPQAAEEMNIPLRSIAKVLIASILMAAAWYIIMILGISLCAPQEVRNSAAIPVADSFAHALNSPAAGKFMIVAALCGILTSWNGFILGAAQVIFAMGRAKCFLRIRKSSSQIPNSHCGYRAGRIDHMPFTIAWKSALVWFVDASAFGTVVAYCIGLLLRGAAQRTGSGKTLQS